MSATQKKSLHKVFKVSQIILPIIAIFMASLLVLLVGSGSLQKLDSKLALAQDKEQSLVTLGQVAGIAKKSEIKIVSKEIVPPLFSGISVLAIDFDSDQILYQKTMVQKYP